MMNMKKGVKIAIFVLLIILLIIVLIVSNLKKKTSSDKYSPVFVIKEDESVEDDKTDKEDGSVEDDKTDKEAIIDRMNEVKFAFLVKEAYEQNPWLKELPIENEGYLIIYDWDMDKFRIRLKMSEDSPEDIKSEMINKAVEDIKRITGEKFDQYTYYILFLD